MERQSSIEKEPLTLNIDQIHLAREAALYVMNTTSVEEALRIFSKGLKPVTNCVRDGCNDELKNAEGELQASLNELRDIVSALF